MKNLILAFAISLMPLASSHAALLVHDPFLTGGSNYNTSASIVGQGPTATGFTGNWLAATTGTATPVSGGLSYTGVDSSGGALVLSGGNNRYGRLLTTPFTAATTGTFYLSFLMDLSSVDGQYKALELHSGGFADATDRNFRLGNGGGANGFNNDDFGFRIAGGPIQNLGAGNTATNFFIVRFDLSATAASDTVTVYRNPTDFAVESNNTGVSLAEQDIVFDRISVAMFTDQVTTFDEFRISTTFAEAIPEPSTALLFGLGSALMLARRRR